MHQITDTQILNLFMLHAVRAALAVDRIAAGYKYGLSAGQATAIDRLSAADLLALTANSPYRCLFVPRSNLEKLLSAPLALVPLYAGSAPAMPSDGGGEERRGGGGNRRHELQ